LRLLPGGGLRAARAPEEGESRAAGPTRKTLLVTLQDENGPRFRVELGRPRLPVRRCLRVVGSGGLCGADAQGQRVAFQVVDAVERGRLGTQVDVARPG